MLKASAGENWLWCFTGQVAVRAPRAAGMARPPRQAVRTAEEGPVGKPIIVVVDEDDAGRRALHDALSIRFGNEYAIVPEISAEACLATLDRLGGRNAAVALVIAAHRRPDPVDCSLFVQVHRSHSCAQRLLVLPLRPGPSDAVLRPLALGQIDDFLLVPWGHPDETFYPQITGMLSAWVRTADPPSFEAVTIVGAQWSARSHELRDRLVRNQVPLGFYTDDSERGRQILRDAHLDGSRLPVVVLWDGRTFVDPSIGDLARAVGGRTTAEPTVYDLTIVGAGPAGLAAAVYGSSEGLRVCVVESEAQGGQAGTSSLIRNYLGFPRGVSGRELARRAGQQAWEFGTTFVYNEACGLRGAGPHRVLTMADGTEATSRAVVLAPGIAYRRLDMPGAEDFVGVGVFYGAGVTEAKAMTGLEVFVAGAGNSAGQAALHFATYAAHVTIVMRGDSLARSMSDYLVQQIGYTANVTVLPCTEVSAVHGEDRVEGLTLRSTDGTTTRRSAAALFIMIGADPHTGWLGDDVLRTSRGYILTGLDLLDDGRRPAGWPLRRLPLPMETSLPGVFAVGDVRHGSVKRVASAVGAGAIAVQFVHQYLASG
jgi:thioredoxin reductase (NADPH)